MTRLRSFVFAAASALALAACGTDYCARPKACSGDPDPTEADRAQCKSELDSYSGDCRGKVEAARNCEADNIKCGADNRIDFTASRAAAQTNCVSQLQAAGGCAPGARDGGS